MTTGAGKKHGKSAALIAAAFLLSGPLFASARYLQAPERAVEELLLKADAFYEKGDYLKAIETYQEAAQASQSRLNLSRAYFGTSLCYFFLRDETNAGVWIRRVLEVDPQKQISKLFYPSPFVDLFQKIREEPAPSRPAAGTDRKQTPPAPPKEKQLAPKETPPVPSSTSQSPAKTGSTLKSWFTQDWRDRFEVEAHFSSWSVNLVKGLFEGDVSSEIGEEIRNKLTDEVLQGRPGLDQGNFEENLILDSSGWNYGFGVRFYPKGREGSFSFGLALERTRMRLTLEGPVRQEYTNGTYAVVDSQTYVETTPTAVHLSFRWDFSTSWRVAPYFVFGLGLASLGGNVVYTYTGTYHWPGPEESISGGEDLTFTEAEEEWDFDIPKVIPIVQLGFGLKAEIYRGLSLRAEASLWDGFLVRGGLAFRF